MMMQSLSPSTKDSRKRTRYGWPASASERIASTSRCMRSLSSDGRWRNFCSFATYVRDSGAPEGHAFVTSTAYPNWPLPIRAPASYPRARSSEPLAGALRPSIERISVAVVAAVARGRMSGVQRTSPRACTMKHVT